MAETKKLDCTGLVCPMPVAKTKKLLNNMSSNEILEVIGDFGEAGVNIIRFVEKQGYKVLESNIQGDNYKIKIKKI